MRKKVLLFTVSLLAFGFTFVNVKAAANCEDARQAELIKIANAITTNYEEEEYSTGEKVDSEGYENVDEVLTRFKISIYNVTSDIYIEVTNDTNKNSVTYKGSDYSEGIITFTQDDMSALTNYTLKVYSADASCYGNLLTTKYISLPVANPYYEYEFCQEHEDLDFCQKYINYEPISLPEYSKKINDYYGVNNKVNDNDNNKVTEFVKDNKYIFIGVGCVVLLALGAAIYITAKRKRSKLV